MLKDLKECIGHVADEIQQRNRWSKLWGVVKDTRRIEIALDMAEIVLNCLFRSMQCAEDKLCREEREEAEEKERRATEARLQLRRLIGVGRRHSI